MSIRQKKHHGRQYFNLINELVYLPTQHYSTQNSLYFDPRLQQHHRKHL